MILWAFECTVVWLCSFDVFADLLLYLFGDGVEHWGHVLEIAHAQRQPMLDPRTFATVSLRTGTPNIFDLIILEAAEHTAKKAHIFVLVGYHSLNIFIGHANKIL